MDSPILARIIAENPRVFRKGQVLHFGTVEGAGAASVFEAGNAGRFTRHIDPLTGERVGGASYLRLMTTLATLSPEQLSNALSMLQRGGRLSPAYAGHLESLSELRALLFDTEVHRDPRNALFSAMAHDLLMTGRIAPGEGGGLTDFTLVDLVREHPAAAQGAVAGFRLADQLLGGPDPSRPNWMTIRNTMRAFRVSAETAAMMIRTENTARQLGLLQIWYARNIPTVPFQEIAPHLGELLRRYYNSR
jgi:hypothetical protein